MFYEFLSLSSLPDISNWDTNNIFDMSDLFYGCTSLSSLYFLKPHIENKIYYLNIINLLLMHEIRYYFFRFILL